MKKFKYIIIGAVLALGLMQTQALEILSKPFINGSNVVVAAGATVTNGYSNIYMKGGAAVTNNNAFQYVTLQKNADGTTGLYNFSIAITGTNALATNTYTVNFVTKANERGRNATEGQGKWALTFNAAGLVTQLNTNVPTAFIQGSKYLTISSISTAGAGLGTMIIEDASLNGAQ